MTKNAKNDDRRTNTGDTESLIELESIVISDSKK